jgi:hypothetical protein
LRPFERRPSEVRARRAGGYAVSHSRDSS